MCMSASGLFQKFRQIVVGEKHPSEELKELKKLIFQPPFIMSEDAGRFSRGMSCFQQYEKTVSQSLVVCALTQRTSL